MSDCLTLMTSLPCIKSNVLLKSSTHELVVEGIQLWAEFYIFRTWNTGNIFSKWHIHYKSFTLSIRLIFCSPVANCVSKGFISSIRTLVA